VSNDPINLDSQRGMAAQKATEIRRLLAEVQANEASLRMQQAELEVRLTAAPAGSWEEAGEKFRYLIGLFAASPAGQDPRRQLLIAAALKDLETLSAKSP
jgi:hypothetical protein